MTQHGNNASGREEAIQAALEPTMTSHGSSRAKEWARCRFAHHLRHTAGLKPARPRDYFQLGILLAACFAYKRRGRIEEIATGGAPNRRYSDVLDYARDHDLFPAFDGNGDPVDVVKQARFILGAYELHYDRGLEFDAMKEGVPVEAERLLTGVIGGEPATARADAILDLDGRLVLVDDKAYARRRTSDHDEEVESLMTDPQFLRLSYLLRAELNLPYAPHVIQNTIYKTKVPGFERYHVPLENEHLDAWAEAEELRFQLDESANDGKATLTSNGGIILLDRERHLPIFKNYHECAPRMGPRCWAFTYCHGTLAQREKEFEVSK